MKKIEWNEKFNVNVKQIDKQHKRLIAIINCLIIEDDNEPAPEPETVFDVIDEMMQYLSYHFDTEEKYMRDCGYPEYEAHKQQHDFFKKETLEYITRISEGNLDISDEILQFLTTWLIGHIIGSDAKYAPYLSDKGID